MTAARAAIARTPGDSVARGRRKQRGYDVRTECVADMKTGMSDGAEALAFRFGLPLIFAGRPRGVRAGSARSEVLNLKLEVRRLKDKARGEFLARAEFGMVN